MENFFLAHKPCFATLLDMTNVYRKAEARRVLGAILYPQMLKTGYEFPGLIGTLYYSYIYFLIRNGFLVESKLIGSLHEVTHPALTAKGRECLTHRDCGLSCKWKYDCLFDRSLDKWK